MISLNSANNEYLLEWIIQADDACHALFNNEKQEDLHDFRVNVRRIISYIDAYEDSFGLNKGDFKKLHKLVKLSNEPRDIEVFLAWLNENLSTFKDQETKEIVTWLKPVVLHRLGESRESAIHQLKKKWPKLKKILQNFENYSNKSRKINFVSVSNNAIQNQTVFLLKQLTKVRSVLTSSHFERSAMATMPEIEHSIAQMTEYPSSTDFDDFSTKQKISAIHRVDSSETSQRDASNIIESPLLMMALHKLRIGIKQLRYLMEAATLYQDCSREIKMLKTWQDRLGEIHDISRFKDFLYSIALAQAIEEIDILFENKDKLFKGLAQTDPLQASHREILMMVYNHAMQHQRILLQRVQEAIESNELSIFLKSILTTLKIQSQLPVH